MNEHNWKHYLKYAFRTYREGWKIAPGVLTLHLVSMLLFDVGLTYAVLYINKAIVTAVTEQKSVPVAVSCIIALFVIAISSKLLKVAEQIINEKISLLLQLKDENRIIEKVGRVQYELLEQPSYYDTFSLVDSNVSSSVLQFVKDLHTVSVGIINMIISIILLASYGAWLGIAFSVAEILYMFLYLKYYDYQTSLRVKSAPARRKIKQLKSLLFEKESVIDVKLNDAEEMLTDKMNESYDQLYKAYCQKNRARIFLDSWTDVYHNIRDAVIMLLYLIRVFNGVISIADYTFITGLIGKAGEAAGTPVSYFGILIDDLRYVSEYYDFINLPDERNGKDIQTDKAVPSEIKAANFSFHYPESDITVLKDINLSIKPGEIVAIVGENGAGKTTLAKNLMGLYSTYEGSLSIDGTDYKEYSAKAIYDRFSVVMQDYMKYPFTLRDNILISDYNIAPADKETFDKYLDSAGGKNIVNGLKNGYDTYLNKEMDEDGSDLSEGQWQKVMLARAMHRKRGIVIFDEPTASLDPIAEETFYKNVIDEADGRTVIVITHRLACTAAADKIIVMKDGSIAESGTHEQLIKQNGIYAEMYRIQASGYAEGLMTAKEES